MIRFLYSLVEMLFVSLVVVLCTAAIIFVAAPEVVLGAVAALMSIYS